MGMTMAEKILARASGRERVTPGEYVIARVDKIMGHDNSFLHAYEILQANGFTRVADPDRIVVVIDHRVPALNVKAADGHRKMRAWVKQLGIKSFYDVGMGICHTLMPEQGHALPGTLVVGGDSHTTTYGALGCASTGLGYSEIAYSMYKGENWFQVPETIRFEMKGRLGRGVTSKDLMLHIAGTFKAEVAQYKAVEFGGPVARDLSLSDRITMSNMGVEIGAKFAFFEADEKTLAYLRGRTDRPVRTFGPDPDARYLAVHEFDASALEPQVACPHFVDNVKPISAVGDVPVQQAFIGSCTNARVEDLQRAAAILKGRRVHSGTRLLLIPASQEVLAESVRNGVIQTFVEAGALISPPGCGPCGGGSTGILAPGETCISSTNRNFKGRMGSPESQLYLGSPETVAASAIAGRITDPRKYMA
ncbi:MAG: 3-isopropylmalate dehydratase large subunit [Candidatus Lambdaproteobacteria bacterium]|nr:3-isopropylmalate dehydratase large subunit [Candidatus Lambdaproteobacteria bacterium]